MFTFHRRFHPPLGGLIILLAISLVACQVFDPIQNDQVPTQDVGEEPPTLFSTSTPVSPAPGSPISLEQPFAKAAFQEGPFDFEFYLYQDPGFSRNPSMTWMYSDIPGVGTHVSWVYHGPGLDNPVVELWGICPDISPRGTYPGLKEGDSSIREGGILLPQDVTPGSVVQFVLKVETSQRVYAGPTVECISELQSSFISFH